MGEEDYEFDFLAAATQAAVEREAREAHEVAEAAFGKSRRASGKNWPPPSLDRSHWCDEATSQAKQFNRPISAISKSYHKQRGDDGFLRGPPHGHSSPSKQWLHTRETASPPSPIERG